MSSRYEHETSCAVPGGVRLTGRTVLPEDTTITALPLPDRRAVRLEGGFATMPPDAARTLAAALIAAADAVEAPGLAVLRDEAAKDIAATAALYEEGR